MTPDEARKALHLVGRFRVRWFEKERGFLVYGRDTSELNTVMNAVDAANQVPYGLWSVGTARHGRIFKAWIWAPLSKLAKWAAAT